MIIKNIGSNFPGGSVDRKTKARNVPPAGRGDNVHISSEARKQFANIPIVSNASVILGKIDEVRQEKIDLISNQIQEGYAFDREKLEKIFERLMQVDYL